MTSGNIAASGIAVGTLIGVVIAGFFGIYGWYHKLDRQIEEIAAETNSRLPKMVDGVTRLDRVNTAHNSIIIESTIIGPAGDQMSSDQKTNLERNVRERIASNSEMIGTLKLGITVRYIYHSEKGEMLRDFSITPNDIE